MQWKNGRLSRSKFNFCRREKAHTQILNSRKFWRKYLSTMRNGAERDNRFQMAFLDGWTFYSALFFSTDSSPLVKRTERSFYYVWKHAAFILFILENIPCVFYIKQNNRWRYYFPLLFCITTYFLPFLLSFGDKLQFLFMIWLHTPRINLLYFTLNYIVFYF